MLVATYKYDSEDYENLDTELWDMFIENIHYQLSARKFPLQLIALNSNWRGQTGHATANSIDELIQKVTSFDSSFYELHKIGNGYEFRLATHDRPTGFTIQIRNIK